MDAELAELPLVEPPPRGTLPAAAGGESASPAIPHRPRGRLTTPLGRNVVKAVELDITGNEPIRREVELDALPLARSSSAVASSTPPLASVGAVAKDSSPSSASPLSANPPPRVAPPPSSILAADPLIIPEAAGVVTRRRGTYNCSACGQPKRGHVCPGRGADISEPPAVKRKKAKSTVDASTLAMPPVPIPAAAGAISISVSQTKRKKAKGTVAAATLAAPSIPAAAAPVSQVIKASPPKKPSKKRKAKEEDSDDDVNEKRLARWKSKPSAV